MSQLQSTCIHSLLFSYLSFVVESVQIQVLMSGTSLCHAPDAPFQRNSLPHVSVVTGARHKLSDTFVRESGRAGPNFVMQHSTTATYTTAGAAKARHFGSFVACSLRLRDCPRGVPQHLHDHGGLSVDVENA